MSPAHAPTLDELRDRAARLHDELLRRGLTIATAESCTGGLLAAVLTMHPGSSGYFLGGAAVYSNEAKTALADVPPQLIAGDGAVSGAVAGALARGIRARLGARVGLGITGVAGPGGATPAKPVGLVYVSIDSDPLTSVRTCRWTYDREGNRLASVAAALEYLERLIA